METPIEDNGRVTPSLAKALISKEPKNTKVIGSTINDKASASNNTPTVNDMKDNGIRTNVVVKACYLV